MSPYRAPWWLPGGHLQTIYAVQCARRPRVSYRRERWETPDADFVEIDWLVPSSAWQAEPATVEPAATPLVALFHGLEGCSGSQYAHALMAEVERAGWLGVVVHFRGCGGSPNRLARAYHSGDSEELDWMLRRLRALHGSPIHAVGVSLGGNVLLKWLGEHGSAGAQVVACAAAVSAPVDLMAAGEALGRGFNLVYTRAFLSTLKEKSLAKLVQYPDLYDAARVRNSDTLRAFDNVVTAPLHGFRDTDDYWTRASSKPLLGGIAVPTLMVNARNDPFLPEVALPEANAVSAALTLEFPEEGGHVGFVSGPFPGNLSWLPRRILAFFGSRLC